MLTIEEEAEHTIVEEAAHHGHRFHNQRNAQSGQYNGCGGLDWCVVLYVVWCGVMSCDALSCPVVPNIVLPCHVFHSRTENEMRIGRRQNVKPTCEKHGLQCLPQCEKTRIDFGLSQMASALARRDLY